MEMYKNILDSINSGPMMYVDENHYIRYMNASAAELFKKDGGYDLVGRYLLDCHSPQAAKKVVEYFEKMQRGELEEVEVRKKPGMKGYMQAVKDGEGKVIGYLERHERIHEAIKLLPENIYSSSAKYYDEIQAGRSNNMDIEFYLNEIEPEASVLEVGCGTGRVSLELAKRGNDVMGVDLSESMLAMFNKKIVNNLEDIQGKVKTIQGNMIDYKIDKKFDYIIFPFRVFQLLFSDKHRKACLQNAKTHLKEGGKIIIDIFNPDMSLLDLPKDKKWIDIDIFSDALNARIVRENIFVRHFSKPQIFSYQNIYRVIKDEKVIEEITEPMRISYLYDEQAKTVFNDTGLVVEKQYGFWDYSPVEEGKKCELIYILK